MKSCVKTRSPGATDSSLSECSISSSSGRRMNSLDSPKQAAPGREKGGG